VWKRVCVSSAELTASAGPVAAPDRKPRIGLSDARRRAAIVLAACRPRQWSKNLLLLAAPTAGGVVDDASDIGRVTLAIAAFCLLSSATYLVNDVRDREQDRHHPTKRARPVASGALAPRSALCVAALLCLAGLGIGLALRWQFALLGVGYLALTTSYSLWWRRVIGLDILAIAAGFVIRAAAGGAAVDVGLSRWFLLVTSCGAVFVVAAKRYAELREEHHAGALRHSLGGYSLGMLRAVIALAGSGAAGAYILWVSTRPADGPWYELTIMPVALWLGRYAVLVARGGGEAPEELILGDRPLLAVTLVWVLLFVGAIYVGG